MEDFRERIDLHKRCVGMIQGCDTMPQLRIAVRYSNLAGRKLNGWRPIEAEQMERATNFARKRVLRLYRVEGARGPV